MAASIASSPAEVHSSWQQACNAGDLEGLLALYEADVTMVAQPGTVVTGIDAAKGALSGFLGLKLQIKMEPATVFQSGDIALVLSRWTGDATDADGKPLEFSGTTTDVVRRDPDGAWRLVIDNAYGY
ncbi:MAG: SgcJ/EcaC family oxidoreductase [Candidatus Dormibacteraeota bacterium]|nr:SgcJ/EcaC family oxidoreductase [Candidatus Dormibacteraeota bacterium]